MKKKRLILGLFLLFALTGFAQNLPSAEPAKTQKTSVKTAPNIFELTSDVLKKSHGTQFGKRVRPVNFVFADSKIIDAYLVGISEEKPRKREKRRIKYMSVIRENLIASCERNPYSGKIHLKSGSRTGIISMANPNGFVVKTRSGGRGTEYRWNKITALQLAKMLEFYADQRLKIKDTKKVMEQQKKQAFEQLLAAAVISDWYGFYSAAVRLARKAAETMPTEVKLVESLFLD